MTEKIGKILKGIGGFYYVAVDKEVFECRARGLFRKDNLKPLPGDIAHIEIQENNSGTVVDICERKNYLKRPPVANVDCLIVVSSILSPSPSTLIIDKLTAFAANKGIDAAVIISKSDLAPKEAKALADIYKKAGFAAFCVSNLMPESVRELREYFQKGKTYVFAGNTGVGKSSIINLLDPSFELPAAEISKKLGRGRHTTRHIELFPFLLGYIADTPGFSSFEFDRNDLILKDELACCFIDFREYMDLCKFTGCAHINDKGCAVCKAVEDGFVMESRHKSYVAMYNEVKDIKEWEIK